MDEIIEMGSEAIVMEIASFATYLIEAVGKYILLPGEEVQVIKEGKELNLRLK